MIGLAALIEQAIEHRQDLLARLESEGTDAYRLFHGAAEGRPGLTVDRYGPQRLVQTFREALVPAELAVLAEALGEDLELVYNHRGAAPDVPIETWRRPPAAWLAPRVCREAGLLFEVRARPAPLLFLDLRAGRRLVRSLAAGRSVLNVFAYTCGAGVAAAAGGAREVTNVDFSGSALEIGRRNAELNEVPAERFLLLQEDVLPVLRQLAGLPVKGRGARRGYRRVAARQFELVVLDPPAWSTGRHGAVDVVRDYQSLFKPALLAAAPGGTVLATNHSPAVSREKWRDVLQRCAAKAGRPLRELELLGPEEDFPSFDGRPPLKIAVCQV